MKTTQTMRPFFWAVALTGLMLSGLGFLSTSAYLLIPATSAQVETRDNLTIFSYCRPHANYDILGTVKLPMMVSSERADRVLETLIKKAKKDFPSTQGLILNDEFSKAECIKFKE